MCLAKGVMGTTWVGRVLWEVMGTANDHIGCGAAGWLLADPMVGISLLILELIC